MFIWVFMLGSVLSAPTDEFREFVNEGELRLNDEDFLMRIVPSGYSPQKSQKQGIYQLSPEITNNENYILFIKYMKQGVTLKDLTFNIYDDDMREAAVALFRLLQRAPKEDYDKLKESTQLYINKDMWRYAVHLDSVYTDKENEDPSFILPFITKPNHFVNAETISKALRLKDMRDRNIENQQSVVNQYYKTYYNDNEYITINSNYSGWNIPRNGKDEKINYFREDISLNSYYYGIHLLHPFWMSNDELDLKNPRHAEHYYYAHQQLMARYLLEKEHLKCENGSINQGSDSDYNPYLVHDNGLPFPTRSCIRGDWNVEKALLKSIDIALKECISRGLIVMDNGTTINMTSDSHIDLLAKLIRANLDGVKTAKIVRSVFGYGGNGVSIDQYSPAPSVLHYPETSLRDPVYWNLINYMLKYFTDYKNTMEPYDISEYESDNIVIVDHSFTNITTYFQPYVFSISRASSDSNDIFALLPLIAAKQKRLQHLPFTLNFTVESQHDKDAVVRLFLGPECKNDCWMEYSKFFELDSFHYNLQEGSNIISWSPETSSRFSFDDYFNLEHLSKENKYNIFKFPENLLIPKGLAEGLNMTLFIMITHADDDFNKISFPPTFYGQVSSEVDSKPLGFPFHRQSSGHKDSASNYKFYPISIYHKRVSVDSKDQFSAHLY